MNSHEFLLKHSQEWSEEYPGKCIALVGDKLVAIGHDELEVFKEAKRKYPDNGMMQGSRRIQSGLSWHVSPFCSMISASIS